MTDISSKLRALTGAHTRIVWAQQQNGCDDWIAAGTDLLLMGIDSDDGGGIRPIVPATGSFSNPMLTLSGSRIIFTDNADKTVNVIDFDGRNRRVICSGYAIGVSTDPLTGAEWVYVKPNNHKSWYSKSGPVERRMIDKPRITESVWTKSSVSWNYFQVSPDGKKIAACCPWPQAGIAGIPDGRFKRFDEGCWTGIAPDTTYRSWIFDGDHRHVKVFDKKGVKIGDLFLDGGPGIKGWEIYHPRWSTDARFVTVTGPWSRNSNRVCKPAQRQCLIEFGGYNVELYIGRIDPSMTKVEKWVKVTSNSKADFHGHAWVDPVR